MRLTLMHNPGAGAERPSRAELIALARDAGHRVRYQDTGATDFARVLDEPADVVLVAGGDGTVAKVAKQLVGRDVPLGIIPLGTANNIARTMGASGSAREIMHGLTESAAATLDVGTASAPWGVTRFIESAGTGFVGSVLRRARDDEARAGADRPTTPVERAARNFLRAFDTYRPVHRHVLADGEDLSGNYLVVEAMNIRSIGPRMALAPRADPGDGCVDLLLVRDTDGQTFADFLTALAEGSAGPAPFDTRRVRRVSFVWDVADGHLDDEPWPERGTGDVTTGGQSAALVEIEIVESPIRVLVPPSSLWQERSAR
jgi:diacylglycerol kinase (ATP)